ncbi:protein SapF [Campylobacter sputorum subsp. bubulus]|uniref:Protein SapF n=1 Tax=Campylobacter sputorum subsp. sputorum TaxID=32024 RepID=A0A381DJB9_9BACT|nr:TolC family protein [Campylobacter sputorum]ASM35802.1 type I secretion system, outer membrane protein, TolC family [Campylobacter sputorum aubsp. sputorum RM3237]KAB0581508.1 TolC family protein [Campylobacter sputorum subsp. sputorum]QEL05992.1 type I secretion system outer membrane protein, TolC family [Campylobacter sputorum subsp. sputorum]SUX09092.1 protein SapF [Campylobacter sputorum subsp. bubulus]SUX10783.1 protein SapF [Campylobacter sputorum subsp. sputorum]
MKNKLLFALVILSQILCAREATLWEAYELALQNDSDLKSKMFENLAIQERSNQTLASLLPSITFESAFMGERYKKGKTHRQLDESFFKYGVNLQQSIFRAPLWYEHSRQKLISKENDIEYENKKQELAKKVAQAYFNYSYAKESLQLALSYENTNKIRYERMEKLLNLGLSNKMDTLEAKVRYDEAILGVNKAKRQIELARLELYKLVGEEIQTKNSFSNLELDFFEKIDTAKFMDVNENLDYKQSIVMREIAQKEYQKRKSEHLPTLDFSIGYYNYDYVDDDDFGDEKNKLESMISFKIPIFSGGATSSRVQEARLLELSSAQKLQDMQKQVEIYQKQMLSDFQNYIFEYKITQNSLTHAQVYEESIQRGYEEKLKDLVDLLDAKSRLFKARNDVLQASYKLVMSYIELNYLIGNISLDTMQDLQNAF